MTVDIESVRPRATARGYHHAHSWRWSAEVHDLLRRHPVLVDAALVLVLLLLTMGAPRDEPWTQSALPVTLRVLMVLPLVWRRRFPRAVFACVSVVAATQWFMWQPLLSDMALLIALYTVAAHCVRAHAVAAFGALEVGIAGAVLRWAPSHSTIQGFVFLSGMAVAAFGIGVNIQTRRAYLASLEDRAWRMERERDQQSQIAAAKERALIAREMHDIVAHNLSVMIALADGAAFTVRTSPDDAESAARFVSATGREALDQMHRLLGVLRGGDGHTSRAPQPGIGQIDDLVTQVRVTGLPTSLTVTGKPFAVTPTAGLAVYRVIQEALTNVLKHARQPYEAKVTLHYADPVVELEITDDGRHREDNRPDDGHGLAGMRERVAVFDGELAAGPRPDGGWRVWARLASVDAR
jgi:signal transduction histidine kinase